MTPDDGARDVLPRPDGHTERLGAHRPPRSPLLDLLPLLVVVLVVAAVGVGVWRLNGATPSTVAASGGPADAAAAGSGDATGTPAPSGTATRGPSPTATPAPSATTATTPAATTPPAPAPTGQVDRSLPVTVLNATGRGGLAGRVAATLRPQGWTALTGNSTARPAATVIYYPDAAHAASAQALATELGGSVVVAQPATELSGRFGSDRITVVLAADATG